MQLDKRIVTETPTGAPARGADLPVDYLSMVSSTFATHFGASLDALEEFVGGRPEFVANGSIYPDEVLLVVSVQYPGRLAALSFHASTEYDPKASAPTAEDLLNVCVDALASFVGGVLDPQAKDLLKQLTEESLSTITIEGGHIPFVWTQTKLGKQEVWIRVDRMNPKMETAADDWLSKNDPLHHQKENAEEAETAQLFRTGQNVSESDSDDQDD